MLRCQDVASLPRDIKQIRLDHVEVHGKFAARVARLPARLGDVLGAQAEEKLLAARRLVACRMARRHRQRQPFTEPQHQP